MELTGKDFELIRRQCELQQDDSDEAIENFTQAYRLAKGYAEALNVRTWRHIPGYVIQDLVHTLGFLTKPETGGKYRTVAVVFGSGDRAIDASLVLRQMGKWAQAFVDGLITPEEVYYQFELIHPFVDGNGRVGHLLWAIYTYRQTQEWPEILPPDVFGKGRTEGFESIFGAVET